MVNIYIFTLLFTLPILSNAMWMLKHNYLVAERLDPIVSGNGTSGHVHSFVGSSAILGDQQNTSCTTSVVKDDRSRYWAPQLYYYSAINNTFNSIPLRKVHTYYLNRAKPKKGQTNTTAFPNGLRMIAGSAMNFNAPLSNKMAANAISFVCQTQAGNVKSSTIPNGPCPLGMMTRIVFPSCWDGVNLDSADHQTHVTYPINGFPDTGDCPSTHPVRLVTLLYEYVWSTNYLQNNANGSFVLANGDTQGWSFHADFISGWNVNTLQAGIDQCTAELFAGVQKCAPFVASLDTKPMCSAAPIVQEQVMGVLPSLPGCNVIRNGVFVGRGAC